MEVGEIGEFIRLGGCRRLSFTGARLCIALGLRGNWMIGPLSLFAHLFVLLFDFFTRV